MRVRLAIVALAALAAGACDAGGNAASASRVDRCTERMLQRVQFEDFPEASRAQIEQYVEQTYCTEFESQGWLYDDGTVSIRAHLALADEGAEECGVAEPGGAERTVPCEELDVAEAPLILDCAVLHHVPRREVEDYLRKLQRSGEVRCDDGTPLAELGAD